MQNGQFVSKIQSFQKHAKNYSKRTLQLFFAKTRSKKHQILVKLGSIENHPFGKGYSPCKGCSLCEMVSLDEKLKMPKTCEKPFYKNIRVGLQKTGPKNAKYSKNGTILKICHLPKSIAHAKAIAFAKWSFWLKNSKFQKHAKNHFTRTLELICSKNYPHKNQMIQK